MKLSNGSVFWLVYEDDDLYYYYSLYLIDNVYTLGYAGVYQLSNDGSSWYCRCIGKKIKSILVFDSTNLNGERYIVRTTKLDEYKHLDEIEITEEMIFDLQQQMGRYSGTILERQLWQNTTSAQET